MRISEYEYENMGERGKHMHNM